MPFRFGYLPHWVLRNASLVCKDARCLSARRASIDHVDARLVDLRRADWSSAYVTRTRLDGAPLEEATLAFACFEVCAAVGRI